jgi:hypothetical protein
MPVTMRIPPYSIETGGTFQASDYINAALAVSTVNLNTGDTNQSYAGVNFSCASVQPRSYQIWGVAGGAFVGINAEL